MAKQLFILRGVPDDEVDEIRVLLTEQQIDFYETPAGSWGMSMPAFWVKDESQFDLAKQLLDEYQVQRQERARVEYEELKQQGSQRGVFDLFKEQPLRYLLYLIFAVVVLYLSLSPFLKLAE